MIKKIIQLFYKKIILPLKEVHAPREEIALGASIGMFWAINPLVGIQMYLVTMTWLIFKFFNIRFNLPIALAMVWITNPLTMPIFYYTFYITGIYFSKLFNVNFVILSFDKFKMVIERTTSLGFIDGIWYWIQFLLDDFGIPALIGGLVWAIPLSILTYPIVFRFITKHRTELAKKEGITLEEWEKKHIHSLKEILQSEILKK
ncbi:MAG: hypothetical protein KatS3mg129_2350 [Leptospiraceae bacterium]|nr:MAG: hypothetical protein KatS3mg129_2350 [Leptospiraceae bacterium]